MLGILRETRDLTRGGVLGFILDFWKRYKIGKLNSAFKVQVFKTVFTGKL